MSRARILVVFAIGFLARPFHAEQLTTEVQGALDRPLAARPAHREAERAERDGQQCKQRSHRQCESGSHRILRGRRGKFD